MPRAVENFPTLGWRDTIQGKPARCEPCLFKRFFVLAVTPTRGPGKLGVLRADSGLAPTLCPNVGAIQWVAPGRSCRGARSCSEQTNREAGLGNYGRRGAPPDEGEAMPRPYIVSQRRGDPLVAPGRSCRGARSCSEQTNREAGLGNCGRRGAPPDKGEAVPRPLFD